MLVVFKKKEFEVLRLKQVSALHVEATVEHRTKSETVIRNGTGGYRFAKDFNYERASQLAIEVAAARCLSGIML